MRRRIFFSLLLVLGLNGLAAGFPWHKPQPLPYVPPYFGYYPTQWREFPPCETTVDKSTPVISTPEEKKPIEMLPAPKKETKLAFPIIRGANPDPYLPPPDPVPSTRVEQFRLPLATLGTPMPAK
jgi:hypothetical protein